jgi:hypothetical protein
MRCRSSIYAPDCNCENTGEPCTFLPSLSAASLAYWQGQGNATMDATAAAQQGYSLQPQHGDAAMAMVVGLSAQVFALELDVKSLRALVNEIKNRVL